MLTTPQTIDIPLLMGQAMAEKAIEAGACTDEDLRRAGFTGRQIADHGEAARDHARRVLAERGVFDPWTAQTLAASQRAEIDTLAKEARANACRRPDHARILAMWAGISARDAGMVADDNPFGPDTPDLHQGWGIGFAKQRRTMLPKGKTLRLRKPTPTHASMTHEAMAE